MLNGEQVDNYTQILVENIAFFQEQENQDGHMSAFRSQ